MGLGTGVHGGMSPSPSVAGSPGAMGGGGQGMTAGLGFNSFALRNLMTQLGPQGFQDMMMAMRQGGAVPAAQPAQPAMASPTAALPRPQNVMPQTPAPVPVRSPNFPDGAQGGLGQLIQMMLAQRFGLGLPYGGPR